LFARRRWYLSALFAFCVAQSIAVHANDNVLTDGVSSLTLEDAATAIHAMPPELRDRVLGDRKNLSQAIGNILIDGRVEVAARAAGVADLPDVKAGIARATQQLIVRKYLEEENRKFAAQAPDFTVRARELYEVNKASYGAREAIETAHIMFVVNPEIGNATEAEVRAKAEKVLQELRSGADFEAMAREHSEDPKSAIKGGVLGWQERGTFVPPFEKAAWALKPGEISDVVRTRFGFHIIKQLRYRPATTPSFEEVKDKIVAKLKEDYVAQRRNELFAKFAGTRQVEIDDKTIEALRRK
jgi:peptidyl-prolyl cis-trans isomerase C